MAIKDQLLAALFVLIAWWSSTGVILLIDGQPRSTFRFSVTGASVLALLGLGGLSWVSRNDSQHAAYLAFVCALAVWAWHELTFLLGLVTGPRKDPCPPDARGWRRFAYATAAIIYHELALAGTLLAVVALTWGAPNQVGTWTFFVLWIMRLSAKLNVFLGVRNLATEFIPAHLRYLLSYFRKARMNPLMPVSLLLGGAVVVHLFTAVDGGAATGAVAVGRTLVATLLALAVLEHLFLMLPLPDALLWRWALRAGHGQPAELPSAPDCRPAPPRPIP
jgi:putative photosynthetic complex assembly protein 2